MLYSIVDIIALKQSSSVLSKEEINWFVSELINGNIHDAQLGAMLMAIYLRGMANEETVQLTSAMMKSGDVLSWPEEWKVVDKHSTGGVGDKVSIVLAPALAACGVKVPMISGRSLGFTGGTLDKMESIPGYNVNLSAADMLSVLTDVGCCIVGQTGKLVPADKILYSLRDITSTVASNPLICSSIISKKAAEGIQSLVLDVKYGKGSFQKSVEDAKTLSHLLTTTSQGLGIKTTSFITSMEDPLGYTIGNSLEVIEAVECLRGNGPADLVELVSEQGGELLHLVGQVSSQEEGKLQILKVLKNGEAMKKFQRMLNAQGVSEDISSKLCEQPESVLPLSTHTTTLYVSKSGKITSIDPLACAEVSALLGGGRSKPTDKITHNTGMKLLKSLGSMVEKDGPWIIVYHTEEILNPKLKKKLEDAIEISFDEMDQVDNSQTGSKIHSIVRRCIKPVMVSQ